LFSAGYPGISANPSENYRCNNFQAFANISRIWKFPENFWNC